eukprot:2866553-Rhodomonas_salina.1
MSVPHIASTIRYLSTAHPYDYTPCQYRTSRAPYAISVPHIPGLYAVSVGPYAMSVTHIVRTIRCVSIGHRYDHTPCQ